ncbi:MAG: N-6 DNA methylase, partial [Planctomycetota bacterium]
VQDTARLVQECAFEHWHRMLFARFLAETDLLIEPDSSVAITLDEVQELAREKATDWLELASDYAERMLPQIFRKDDPVLQIALPPETRSEMEDLLKSLSKPVFEADDSLGWVYQFWQSDKKDEVNKSETKIGADELPAVTQLFTEDYMVLFLLHNTLGAWWAGKVLAANPNIATSASDEAAVRAACKVGDIDWTYLRFVRDNADDGTEGPWRPAAGVFEGWPKAAKELTVLDPCMGSGHFLVFALPILVAFRMAEEGFSRSATVDAVLKDNLFGLEIDPRCTQIAAFNLAFAAWRRGGHRPLPQLNLACSGLAIGVTKAEWLKLAEKAVTAADPAAKRDLLGVEKNLLTVGLEERAKNGLQALYELFAKAPWLGSLIDPRRAGADIFREGFDKLEPLLATILSTADTDEAREMAVAAQGMAKASELLTRDFSLAVTNVPFLGRGKQSDDLKSHIETYYADAKSDLATAMLRRILRMLSSGGTVAAVTPQNWLFLGSFKDLRKRLLDETTIATVAALGSRAFETISGEVVNAVLIALSRKSSRMESTFLGFDCNSGANPTIKALELSNGTIRELNQRAQVANPDHRIVVSDLESGSTLDAYAQSFQGIKTGDDSRYRRNVWELGRATKQWRFIQTTVESTRSFGGLDGLVDWSDNGRHLARLQGLSAHGRAGSAVSQMSDLPAAIYLGCSFDSNVSAIVPIASTDEAAIWAFCSSPEYRQMVRKLEPSMKANNAV